MFNQYFGHYLINKGLISHVQLAEAIELQRSVHLKLGVLAINSGFMDAEQVSEIHNMQTKVDKRFGELAIDMGFLTEDKLNMLLNSQKKGHLLLGQALIDKGYITLEQLQNALNEYKSEHGFTHEQFEKLQADNIDEIIQAFVKFKDTSKNAFYTKYISLLVRNIIRFLDEEPRIELVTGDTITLPRLSSQEIYGDINILTALTGDEATLTAIASKFAGEEIKDFDDLAKDSIGEFLNLHNGIFLVNASNDGLELGMKPQSYAENKTLQLKNSCIISLNMPLGKLTLLLTEY